VGRAIAAGLVLAVGLYLVVDALWTSDTERVEAEVERLLKLGREGGPGAAAEILDALAGDYRGTSPFTAKEIALNLDRYVATERVANLKNGSYDAIWKGDEIVVPLLVLDADVGSRAGRLYLSIVFAERDGRWKVVDIIRPFGR